MVFDVPVLTTFHVRGRPCTYTYLGFVADQRCPYNFWVRSRDEVGYVATFSEFWPSYALREHIFILVPRLDDHLDAICRYGDHVRAVGAVGDRWRLPLDVESHVLRFLGIRRRPANE